MTERLRQLLVPEERSFTWDGGINPGGSKWHTGSTIVNVTSKVIVTKSRTFQFADIDKVEKSKAWSKSDPHVGIRLYPSYRHNSLRLDDHWRSEEELDEIIELIEKLSSHARTLN